MSPTPTKSLADQLADAREIIRQKNHKLVLVERELRKRSRDNDSAERIRQEIYGLAEITPEPPAWLDREPGKSTSGVPLLNLSDWHWGESVDADQVGGVNKFNRQIARKRVKILHDTVIDLCFNHMTNPDYPGIVVCLSGDMITGAIHDDLRETNDGPVTWSVIEVENQILGVLNSLTKRFKKVFVTCVPGNHGRNTLKPRAKNRVFDSYEWLI